MTPGAAALAERSPLEGKKSDEGAGRLREQGGGMRPATGPRQQQGQVLWVRGRQELTSSIHRALGAREKLAEKHTEWMKRRKLGPLRYTEHKWEPISSPP